MEDFADAAELVGKLGQATTKGEMLGLVLGYRKKVRSALAAPPQAPRSADQERTPYERGFANGLRAAHQEATAPDQRSA
jgi:hypothetical protein